MAILFYSKTPDYAWLSNFSEHSFVLDDLRWPSVEHFYQAQKQTDADICEQIRKAESPLQALKMGRNKSHPLKTEWPEIKEAVMQRAIHAKFEQNREIRELLLATGNEELNHLSRTDSFWGQNEAGEGENRLGLLIMALRKELQASL